MGKIIWLASYPKSGNTWIRLFLDNYGSNSKQPSDINDLQTFTFGGSSRTNYQAVIEKPLDDLTDSEIFALSPQAQQYMTTLKSGPVFAKTHSFFPQSSDAPFIVPQYAEAAIYIVRNPLDLVISLADHYGLTLDQGISFLNNPSGSTARTNTLIRQVFRSWKINVDSWLSQDQIKIQVVRYEDLLSKPNISFSKITKFLEYRPQRRRLQNAIRNSSFGVLQDQEQKSGFNEKSDKNGMFFRSGTSGQWKEKLTPNQIEAIIEPNFDLMNKLDYIPQEYR